MDRQPRGPDWMQITPKAGALFHATSQTCSRSRMRRDSAKVRTVLSITPRALVRLGRRRLACGADLFGPGACSAPTTVYNRFNRCRKAGIWDKLMDAIIEAPDGKVQMIDSSIVRVHRQAAAQKTAWRGLYRSKSRRTDDQAASAGDRQRPSGADRIVARPDERPADGRTSAQ